MRISDNGVDRDMTAAEETAHKALQVIAQTDAKTETDLQTAKDVARQAVLDKLGLTANEAAALFG